MIRLICSPGLGHLDNALPLINKFKNENKFSCSILFTKKSMITQLINNPSLLKLYNKSFNERYLIINNKAIIFNDVKKINLFLKKRILNILIFHFLIPLNIYFLSKIILKNLT